jgi:hypothetical protein
LGWPGAGSIGTASLYAAICWAVFMPGRAHAQLLERYEPTGIPGYPDWFTDSVQPAHDTGYEPMPIKLGAVQVDPVLSEGVGYDTNVLNSKTAISSPSIETAASVHAGTTWARNAIDLSITADDIRYLDAAAQSYTDWTASAGGRWDIDEDNATLAFSHANIVSLPTQIGTFGFFEPLRTVIEDGRGSYQWNMGRFSATPSVDIADYTNSGGGSSENEVRRDDRIAYTATLSLAYALSSGASLVLIGSDTQARFSYTLPGTPVLNYGDASILAGIDVHPEGVLRYRALIGYEQLDYAKSGLPGVSAPAAELDAVWQPTALTTLTGRVTQSLQNSPGATTGTYTYTAVHARIDHAYLRNLILDASVDYQAGDFTDSNERQSVFAANLGARWQLNRGLELSVNESFQALQATGGTRLSTTRNVVSVQVTFRPGAFD